MSQFILAQTVAGGGSDFNGSAGAGLFLFPVTLLPKNQKVVCAQLGVFGLAATATWLNAYFEPPAGQLGSRILIGAATMSDLAGVDGNLGVTFCPGEVPRSSSGEFWLLKVYSSGLSDEATATLSYNTEQCCP